MEIKKFNSSVDSNEIGESQDLEDGSDFTENSPFLEMARDIRKNVENTLKKEPPSNEVNEFLRFFLPFPDYYQEFLHTLWIQSFSKLENVMKSQAVHQ